MKKWVTEYANAADDGAPYVGPTIYAEDAQGAKVIAALIEGPNGERIEVKGELIERIDARVHGDTHSIIRRIDE